MMDFGDILGDWEKLSARPGGLEKAAEEERRLREEDLRSRSGASAPRQGAGQGKAGGKGGPPRKDARDSLAAWLDSHGVEDKDSRGPGQAGRAGAAGGTGAAGDDEDPRAIRAMREAEARRVAAKRPDAVLDLHGMTGAEAESALSAFLEASARRGCEKVLVVTGKGIHSQGEPVLGKAARRAIEASPWAGRFGVADAASGGGGALWVVLKRGSISRGR